MTNSQFYLNGKTALVTGGNSGIGKALATALADAGARVAVAGRRVDRNRQAAEELGPGHVAVELDVADEASVAAALAETLKSFERLDILVNNAGFAHGSSVMEFALADWRRELDVNLTGPFLCTKHAARHMTSRGSGKIINVASIYGLTAPSKGRLSAYVASKHGLIGLTKVNAVELSPLGVQVNAIAPGWYWTELTEGARGTVQDEGVRRRTPAGRWGEARELGGACVFLASPASDWVTGTVLTVDGGYFASDGLER
jgi:NAD(P)-dependent dehydrogenase (short-subunit alcohol dehydrogenase family)